ncbi:ArsR/SmtB family transcription factor [Enterococcus timonensis]|uniref:ArsR/SmtB family transcription factor n=1 Tax=Enterococcus timonensis TaxID=1852364 RepID=UPI0008D94296|nr:metalloregulator ArsR/SmtB family transcription factor [Enterococcus timonensis]
MYKVLGDKTRLKILLFLKSGEKNVTTIAQEVAMEQSAVSHQLKLLRDNKIVISRREGKVIYYALADHHVMDILNQTFEHVLHS